MKWIKASEHFPDDPNEKVFRKKMGSIFQYLQTEDFFDEYLVFDGKEILYSNLEWLDESSSAEESETPVKESKGDKPTMKELLRQIFGDEAANNEDIVDFYERVMKTAIEENTPKSNAKESIEGGKGGELMKYVEDSIKETGHIYGEIQKISKYGGSIFAMFNGKKCYRLQWQSYDQAVVTMDAATPPTESNELLTPSKEIDWVKRYEFLRQNLNMSEAIQSIVKTVQSLATDKSNEAIDHNWKYLGDKFKDILYEANGTGSGADDIIEYLRLNHYKLFSGNEAWERKFSLKEALFIYNRTDEPCYCNECTKMRQEYFSENFSIDLEKVK